MTMKKRAHGDGYVKRLPNGTWSGQLMDGYKADGKKNIVNFSAPTKSEVQHKMRCYMENRAESDAQPEMPTFCGWADTWYKSYRTEVKPSTYSGYKHTLAHLKTYFGDTPITSKIFQRQQLTHVFLSGLGLEKPSIALCEQVMAIDKARLRKKIGYISELFTQLQLAYALKMQMGLEPLLHPAA